MCGLASKVYKDHHHSGGIVTYCRVMYDTSGPFTTLQESQLPESKPIASTIEVQGSQVVEKYMWEIYGERQREGCVMVCIPPQRGWGLGTREGPYSKIYADQ